LRKYSDTKAATPAVILVDEKGREGRGGEAKGYL